MKRLAAAVLAVLLLAGCARHVTPTAQPTSPTASQANSAYPSATTMPTPAVCDFPAHIYHPARLKYLGCATVTGLAVARKAEPDGDYHVRFQLDPAYTALLTTANQTYQAGTLVVEEPCQHGITQPDAVAACASYTSPWPPLTVGKRYRLTGNYVLDLGHGGWAELHGLSGVEAIS